MKNSAKYFQLNFIKKEKVSKDVFSFYFNRLKHDSLGQLGFLAGQYVHIYLPIVNEKGRGDSRMFTISSSPLEEDYLVITTKKGKSLFKKTLFNLKENTSVKFFGPSGGLVLNEKKKISYVFLALGIGITLFRSIIKYVSQKNIKIPITLIVSFSKKEDFLFYSELSKISKSNPSIKVVYALNRIDKKLIKKYIKNVSKYVYFLVGSPSGVIDLEEVVSEMGVENNNIFIEDFEGY